MAKWLLVLLVVSAFIFLGCSGSSQGELPAMAANLPPVFPQGNSGNASGGQLLPDSNIIPTKYPVPIQFSPGTETYAWTVSLNPDVPQTFEFPGHAGQLLFVNKTGELRIQIYAPDLHALTTPNSQIGPWELTLPQDGVYRMAVAGQGQGEISIYMPVPLQIWIPVNTTAPIDTSPTRVAYDKGTNHATASAVLKEGRQAGFTLYGQAGEHIAIRVQGQATIAVLDQEDANVAPKSMAMVNASVLTTDWSYDLPTTGNYMIVLLGTGLNQLTITLK